MLLIMLGNNDEFCGRGLSRVVWDSVAGATYRIQVTGFRESDSGAFQLTVVGSESLVEVPGTSASLLCEVSSHRPSSTFYL
jgi:hypothetical protein